MSKHDLLTCMSLEIAEDPELYDAVADEQVDFEIALELYRVRINAGLNQKELAELVGTTQSAIARLEDASYSGRSIALLKRIANALGQKLQVGFVDRPRPTAKHSVSGKYRVLEVANHSYDAKTAKFTVAATTALQAVISDCSKAIEAMRWSELGEQVSDSEPTRPFNVAPPHEHQRAVVEHCN